MGTHRLRSQKGLATVEFSVIATIALLMAFIIVDFGALIQAQAVVTNVTREGGSLASRDLKTGDDLMNLLQSGSAPLHFQSNLDQFKIFIVKVNAAEDGESSPSCAKDAAAVANGYFNESGNLEDSNPEFQGQHVTNPVDDPSGRCGLPQELWDLLQYNDDPQVMASAVPQFTMVKVFWVHQPMTPLEGILHMSGDGAMNFDYLDNVGAVAKGQGAHDNVADSMLLSSTALF